VRDPEGWFGLTAAYGDNPNHIPGARGGDEAGTARSRLQHIRILIDTTFALRGPSGTGVYLERLVAALRALGVDVVEAQHEGRRAPAAGGWRSALNAAGDEWWTKVGLPRKLREANADVLHHPLPAFSVRVQAPQIVTVHDLAFERLPEHFDPRYRRFAALSHRTAARRAAVVIAVSHSTANDVMARWGVPAERIVVAPHGPGQEPAGPRGAGAAEHFLYVGDDERRKNVGLLLDAYRRYRSDVADPLPLVLAGNVSRGKGAAGVRHVERPEHQELDALYHDAVALVHPSLHEGFGLTPLEAMTAGTPVIAARSPGVTETCGDAVIYVDPHDPGDVAAQLARVASDPTLRRDLAERGRRRAAEFSWARSARRHVEAYTLALHPVGAVHG
jgi:glycosyltransferase involved in cell wall biosynthesis